jgi:aspartate kinase
VVPAARRIGTLSYEETQEMAESGAKVLNAQAVEFAKEKGIAIYARATSGPLPGADPSADGTVVRRDAPRPPGAVAGIASERDVLILESDAPFEDLLSALDVQHVAGKQLHVGATPAHTTLVVSRENLHDEARVRGALDARFGQRVRLVDGIGAVSAIGAGINATYANVCAGTATLRTRGIEPRGVATSSFRITWMVPRTRVDEAVRALHERFIGSSQPLVP